MPSKYSKHSYKSQSLVRDDEEDEAGTADERKWLLSDRRQVSVRSFKGTTFCDLRELYLDRQDGQWKPGKKGLTLNLDELEELLKIGNECMEHLSKNVTRQTGDSSPKKGNKAPRRDREQVDQKGAELANPVKKIKALSEDEED